MYSNIDVTCLVPAHIAIDTSSTNDTKEDLQERCGICKTVVNVDEAKTIMQHTTDIIQLPCQHYFHYECLREACKQHSNPKNGRECAVCRHSYKPFPLMLGETHVPHFHENIASTDAHIAKAMIDWNTILSGQNVYISRKVAKRKFKVGVFVRQTKQQAEIKFEDGSSARYAKTNLWKIVQ